ncbi:MAG: cobyrinate a,c-diamide synthase [candidate division Zixibacteria bacterium]|nr:cobyrinate a,c-diamide synthase [candidate division Zixibacteria bacterium]
MALKVPRLVIAGLSGDAGKTITSLCLTSALKGRGMTVAAFKKGPDYIDSAWLSMVSGSTCRNLDTFMVDADIVADTFSRKAEGSDVAIIEGNRGIFDGKDAHGTHSTAMLAALLQAPVILVVNATKTTRTLAALVGGCMAFDPDIRIAGVVLNRVAGERHRRVVTEAIEQYCKIPVLGAFRKLGDDASVIPGRHLGLVTPNEFHHTSDLKTRLLRMADDYLDVDRLLEIARSAGPLTLRARTSPPPVQKTGVRIGYFSDSVFTFYYPENLEALETGGAELVPVSSLSDISLPDIDGLYIGGGFPETHAEELAGNRSLMDAVTAAAGNGMPIYAECGGLIYLARSLAWHGRTFAMAGLFPLDLAMKARPAGHGYAVMRVDQPNPFFDTGTVIKGHEFHYSEPTTPPELDTCLAVETGVGLGNTRDGLRQGNCVAAYLHMHADGVPSWGRNMVKAAADFKASRGTRAERRGGNALHRDIRLDCNRGCVS